MLDEAAIAEKIEQAEIMNCSCCKYPEEFLTGAIQTEARLQAALLA